MSDYGVQRTGFARKPLSKIVSDLEGVYVDNFGVGAIHTPESPAGQLIGIFSNEVSKAWELAEDVYQSFLA